MRHACHACGGLDLDPFYEVTGIPVHSCLMVSTRAEALDFPSGDLRLELCRGCGFIQNGLFDPARESYSADYEETQGFSPRFRDFARELCLEQIEKYDLRGRRVLEIGCGKGEFLGLLCELGGNQGIGVDPSYRPERTDPAVAARIRFLRELYSDPLARQVDADYVCCRHTLEHIQPVAEFLGTLRQGLAAKRGSPVVFEVPDVGRILDECAFWDVYYEHCSYFTAGSLARLFRRCGFDPADLYTVFDDQYLILEALPGGGRGTALAGEDDLARTARRAASFRERVSAKIHGLRSEVLKRHAAGERLALWGSGSKAVSFLTTLGLGEEIASVVDVNPHKHGRFLAGTGHEISPPEVLREVRPAAVFVMNPVYTEEIAAQLGTLGLAPALRPLD